jgi:hypothetical protein
MMKSQCTPSTERRDTSYHSTDRGYLAMLRMPSSAWPKNQKARSYAGLGVLLYLWIPGYAGRQIIPPKKSF